MYGVARHDGAPRGLGGVPCAEPLRAVLEEPASSAVAAELEEPGHGMVPWLVLTIVSVLGAEALREALP